MPRNATRVTDTIQYIQSIPKSTGYQLRNDNLEVGSPGTATGGLGHSSHRKPHAAPMQRPSTSESTIKLPASAAMDGGTRSGAVVIAQHVR